MSQGILTPGNNLTLRPMKYPQFFQHYKNARKNDWNVDEISFSTDKEHLRDRLTPAEKHVVSRLVAFFATGDTIVGNNLVTVLRKHVNSPEARMYYDRQIFEESVHVEFYLQLLDNYVPDDADRARMFQAIDTIPSIKKKADFCFKWMDTVNDLPELVTDDDRQKFLLNMITFACAVEGLFFFGAFAYVYYLRSKGLLHGLASGTNWVFRDESMHMDVAFDLIDVIRSEYPTLWTKPLEEKVIQMLREAIDCELQFAEDVLDLGIAGFSTGDMKIYLEYCATQRLSRLGIEQRPWGNPSNPFPFMALQDMAEHTNFFERTVSAYRKGTVGTEDQISFNDDF